MDILMASYGKVGARSTLSEHMMMLGLKKESIKDWMISDLVKIVVSQEDAPYVYAWNFCGNRVPYDYTWKDGVMCAKLSGSYFLTFWKRSEKVFFVSQTSVQQDSSPLICPCSSLSPIAVVVETTEFTFGDVLVSSVWEDPVLVPFKVSIPDSEGSVDLSVKEKTLSVSQEVFRKICARDAQLRNSGTFQESREVFVSDTSPVIIAPLNKIVSSGLDVAVPDLEIAKMRQCLPQSTPPFVKSILSSFLVYQVQLRSKKMYYVFGVEEFTEHSWIGVSDLSVVITDVLKWTSAQSQQILGVQVVKPVLPQGVHDVLCAPVLPDPVVVKAVSSVQAPPVTQLFELDQKVTILKKDPARLEIQSSYVPRPAFTHAPLSPYASKVDSSVPTVSIKTPFGSYAVYSPDIAAMNLRSLNKYHHDEPIVLWGYKSAKPMTIVTAVQHCINGTSKALRDLRKEIREYVTCDKLSLNQTLESFVRDGSIKRVMKDNHPHFSIGEPQDVLTTFARRSHVFRVSSNGKQWTISYDGVPVVRDSFISMAFQWGHTYLFDDIVSINGVSENAGFGIHPGYPPGQYEVAFGRGEKLRFNLCVPQQKVSVIASRSPIFSHAMYNGAHISTCSVTVEDMPVVGMGISSVEAHFHARALIYLLSPSSECAEAYLINPTLRNVRV